MSESLPIVIRPIAQIDVSFIFSSWLRSFKSAFFARDIHPTTYYGNHHELIAELIATSKTYVACSASDSTEIYGFICGEHIGTTFVLHYIYVKHTFRNLGIGRQLLAQFPVDDSGVSFYTHQTGVAAKQAAAYHMMYNPYLAFLSRYRKGKSKNSLNLNEKVQEHDNDEQEYKRTLRRTESRAVQKSRTRNGAAENQAGPSGTEEAVQDTQQESTDNNSTAAD